MAMFDSDDWGDIFKHSPGHHHPEFPEFPEFPDISPRGFPVMELVVGLVVAVGLIVIIAVLCRCCCQKSTRGRVLAPPPAIDPTLPAPYPQQQYNTTAYPVVGPTMTVYPVGAAPYPTAGPPQPPYPAPFPPAAPYPSYPTASPYPTGLGYSQAPTAPDVNACPPSYDQVMQHDKQPPYNPHAPR